MVATWNVRTLMDSQDGVRPERRPALMERELSRYDVDIAAISETRLAGEGQLTEHGAGYTFYMKGKPKEERRIHGVGFAVKDSLVHRQTD